MARVNDLTLERYALGELSDEETARVEAALAEDPTLQTRLDDLQAHDAAFLQAHPPAAFIGELVDRHRREQRRRLAVMGGTGLALAAAALLTVGAVTGPAGIDPVQPGTGTDGTPHERIKGDALKVFLQTGDEADRLLDGDAVMPGAVVQVRLTPEHPWGAVYSIDGRGALTRHLPLSGSESVELRAGPLDNSFTLDRVADFERFLLVSADRPFDLASVEAALDDLDGDPDAAPKLAPSFFVDSLLIDKVYP